MHTSSTQPAATVVSTQQSAGETRESHVVRKEAGYRAKLFIGFLFVTLGALRLAMVAPGFAFFLVLGTIVPLTSVVSVFTAVTSRYRGAEDYVDYISSSRKS